jgi:hypothetical protein
MQFPQLLGGMVLGPIGGMHRPIQGRNAFARQCGAMVVALLLSLLSVAPAAAGSDPERFGVGRPMRIDAGERVDTVVTIGGDLTVLGEVEDDAVVIGGTLELGPDARIGGDAVAVGGPLITAEGATIAGERVEMNGAMDDTDDFEFGPFAAAIATFVQVVGAFLISALILALAPQRVRDVATSMRARPGRAALFGLALVLLFLPLLGVLTLSIVGIPLIPVVIMVLAAVLVFGMTALAVSLGYAMPFYSQQRSAFGALAIGYLVIAVISLVPFVGPTLVPLAGLFAAGAVLGRWFGRRAGG